MSPGLPLVPSKHWVSQLCLYSHLSRLGQECSGRQISFCLFSLPGLAAVTGLTGCNKTIIMGPLPADLPTTLLPLTNPVLASRNVRVTQFERICRAWPALRGPRGRRESYRVTESSWEPHACSLSVTGLDWASMLLLCARMSPATASTARCPKYAQYWQAAASSEEADTVCQCEAVVLPRRPALRTSANQGRADLGPTNHRPPPHLTQPARSLAEDLTGNGSRFRS